MEDNRIVELYWERNEQAIKETSLKYGGLCTHIAQNILSSYEDSEECVNDTFFAVWNAIPDERPNIFSAFVSRITRNLALKKYEYLSAAKRNPAAITSLDELGDCVSGTNSVESEFEKRHIERTIDKFLWRQSEEKRNVFIRRYWYFDSIGNIDDKLVQQAEQIPNYVMRNRKKRTKQLLATAAVLVLMFSSFSVGAMAFSREIIIEVPVTQEIIELEGINLSLILPDSWKGQYVVEKNGQNYIVYHLQSKKNVSDRISPWDGGVLFTIVCYEEAMTEEQFIENGLDFTAYRYILATSNKTYVLHYASDVQYDPENEEQKMAYSKMMSEIKDIQFVVNDIFGK